MNEKRGKQKNQDLSLEELIEKLKEQLLVEGTKKANEDDLGSVMRHWQNEDKRH